MKKLSILLLAIAIVASITAGTNAQIKNVLLEQNTGAWCGWCVDGTVVMDEILELYGDQVIGVKVHGGDAMEIPEQSVIGMVLGLTGTIWLSGQEGDVITGGLGENIEGHLIKYYRHGQNYRH
jgi:hypothetical protein